MEDQEIRISAEEQALDPAQQAPEDREEALPVAGDDALAPSPDQQQPAEESLAPQEADASDAATEGLEPEGEADDARDAAEEAEDAADSSVPAQGDAPADDATSDRQWFVVHGYSGYENRVKKNLEQRIESMGMQDKIFQVIVPTEEEIEIRGGERRVVERRVFPGYILVQMIMDETSWYVVRNTPGVTGFVGSGNKPAPLSVEEVDRIMKRIETAEPSIKVSFKVGQKVRLTEGAFADFVGVVDVLYPEKGRARVMVSMFGRDTPLEADLLHLERA